MRQKTRNIKQETRSKSVFTLLFLFLIACFLSLVPAPVLASEIRLDANKAEVRVGEEFIVSAIVHTKEFVNAIEGQVVFPSDLLEVKEIRDGNSVINLWVHPVRNCVSNGVEKPDSVCFSGITPGGFSGANQYLFSIVFTAKKTGDAVISFGDTQMLKNDGLGTKITTALRPVEIIIQLGDDAVRRERVIDIEPPSYFTSTIASSPHLFDSKYFIAFATQDKGSGISHYEILETRSNIQGVWQWTPRRWRVAESPYALQDQALRSYVYIKAIDNAGNERVSITLPQHPLEWYEKWESWTAVVIVFSILYLAYRVYGIWKTKKRNHLRR